MDKTVHDLKAAEQELRKATAHSERSEKRRQELDQELEKIDATLREARDDHRKSKDEERLLTAIRNLKSHFPGVLGRLVDLCRPSQRRFNLAVTVAAGKDMDAIVVDTRVTGIECIRYLREQRVGTATFLPLDSLQIPTQESAERLRARIASDSRFRLAADVITCDETIQKAVLYAVGNAVVCDDLNSARQLCFSPGRNDHAIKAVTLGGAVISKAGTMTGGVTNQDSDRAGRWDDKMAQDLRSKKSKLQEERSNLDKDDSGRPSMGGRSTRMEELRNNYQFLCNKAEYSKSDMEFTRKQLHEKNTLLKSIDREIPSLQDSLQSMEEEIARLQQKHKDAIKAVKESEDTYLAPFRQATGLQDLQAYEQAIRDSRQEFTRKKRTVLEHITHLESQLEYESNRDLDKPIQNLEKRIQNQQRKLKVSKKLEKQLQKQLEVEQSKLEEAEQTLQEATENEKDLENETKELQKDFKEFQNERAKLNKAVSAEEAALERLRGKLHETLQKARVEEVELPLVGVSAQQKKSRRTRSGRRLSAASDEEDNMDEDEEESPTQSQPRSGTSGPTQLSQDIQFSQSQNERVAADKDEASKIDFSNMRSDLKQRLGDREERKVRKEFEDARLKFDGEIEGMVPNMKVSYFGFCFDMFVFVFQ